MEKRYTAGAPEEDVMVFTRVGLAVTAERTALGARESRLARVSASCGVTGAAEAAMAIAIPERAAK